MSKEQEALERSIAEKMAEYQRLEQEAEELRKQMAAQLSKGN